ncbi:cyclophilin-type peptidylprolyl cis-trans isomerase [Encephalitozoon hellem ATCC 50504]|uniref:Peptidyl-prolyl cis-trans isomerase n=1 Tax=Encephalitozoon hellem TaxID=27973 RepID=A0A9Q9FCI7_ENCHE|nr:cyclophilin-type peptidylprolyl cis-trans isomerase [Encephalitozoon hellem ATCC 50504]AFM99272.1 cyclophilin-type peptidylprolyl cis-trans isomerase [Encephalitozoon hellem ATCC 50504]UTX44260.1 peptidyl-prolyl cis-trans isomerase [Encephalitozoon hellem]WEL38946.1 E3 sumo-protein ligase RANBP2 [Encephalitozoon hellem]WEL39751.1 cyclophilin type peptidyl-prolyl cis-trans isomerase [Encephalitozoon hellem]|eukprot:XP_003888253.1 cyclophilin-type peptidylprolyl cis-trans isomerase [Encephalitozoon hellem ATCC 50504]
MKGRSTLLLLLAAAISAFEAGTPYLDLEYVVNGEKRSGRVTFELYWDEAPRTARNFYELVRGTQINGELYKYENSEFHRIIPGFMMQGGDIVNGDGTGSISIYDGKLFEDEEFIRTHSSIGKLSMANRGPNTNGSQFFITFGPQPHLDRRHVVFGNVSQECIPLIESIQRVDISHTKPVAPVRIVRSGIVEEDEKEYL